MSTVLYYDLGSPYAYLAVSRSKLVLGSQARLQPVLAGAIFAHRGWGSWAHTAERERHIAEIGRRAAAYGLPAMRWPAGWPNNTLSAMRLAVWATDAGAGDEFARAAFAAAFADGKDLSDKDALLALASAIGMDREDAELALESAEVKTKLREATDQAIAVGVGGVPTTCVDGQLFYGDDRLESAAVALNGP
jgi:2-hydroxychromene-2-carboxylate isomerase